MKIPILVYQPMRIGAGGYRHNDLVAFAEDLREITAAGFRVVPLRTVVDAWLAGGGGDLDGKLVALTCDGGIDFTYADLDHPQAGPQRSVLNVLRDFAAANRGRQPQLHVTSFVVVSPEARAALDATCMLGKGWWSDGWWKDAIASGFMDLGNNSWDHHHETLPAALAADPRTGTFLSIDSHALADHEVRQAADLLRAKAPNPGAALFAYPYGEASPYLADEYLPEHAEALGIRAAFTAKAGFLTEDTNRWRIPRFVCGRDWSSPAELRRILEAAARREKPAFADFLAARVEPIEGWLHTEAALLTAHLVAAQREHGVSGPTLEIGVYRGKYLSVLYRLSRPPEAVVGIDLFVGSRNTRREADKVRSNIAAACGEANRLKVVVADSLQLTTAKVADEVGAERLRFISIDGGHTRELVRHDLEVATPLLAPGGILALDDAFNHTTPGVTEGIHDFFLGRRPALAPFAVCYNKLFVTTPDFHRAYLAATVRFLEEEAAWLPTHARTRDRRRENEAAGFTPELFGFEILPFL